MAGISRKSFRILRFAEPNPPFPASDNRGSPVRTNSPGWKSMPQESGPGSQEEAMKDVKKRLQEQILSLQKSWKEDPRWKDIRRPYQAEEVVRLRGSLRVHHTLAETGARRFWDLLHSEPYVPALGALTGNQAVQQVHAGLKAIYVSGWQVAGDANSAGHMYPDQSLYPVDSVPKVVSRINNALIRADQIQHMNGGDGTHWFAPIVADGEGGFGGPLNTYELIKAMIEAGAAAIHLEDQISSLKKCGHMGGKVLVPYGVFIEKLVSARLVLRARGPRKGISACGGAWSSPLPGRWSMPRLRTWSGARPPRRTWEKRGSLPRRFGKSIRGKCLRTIARRPSTGSEPSTTPRSPNSRTGWARWDTSSSS